MGVEVEDGIVLSLVVVCLKSAMLEFILTFLGNKDGNKVANSNPLTEL